MKVAIALFALFAVSQAAFTGTLQQQAKPILDQTLFKVNLAVGGARGPISGAIGQYISGLLSGHINNLLAAVQTHTATMADIVHTNEMIQNIANLFGVNALDIVHGLSAQVQEVLTNVNNGLGGNSGRSALLNGVGSIVNQITDLHAQFTAAAAAAQNAVNQLSAENVMQWLQSQLLQLVQGRGLWSSLGNAIGNAWDWGTNAISSAASGAWNAAVTQVNEVVDQVSLAASAGMDAVQAMAQNVMIQASQAGNTMSVATAQAWEAALSGFSAELGPTYDQLMAQLGQITGNAPAAGKQ